jgi:hypothetical protein
VNITQLRALVLKVTRNAKHNGEAAKMMGCSRPQFVNFIRGRRQPTPKMLKRLGLRREWSYIPAPKKEKRASGTKVRKQ